ncbi:MAG TPA: hypothetical protein PK324_05405 [Nocardioides sp.]|uniref:hypothetical protein n=1 Tax=uncultured Nocardioides sp. TaxID=198441 RepID=UPI0026375AE3|nr:hypothetical protein [uncultured Nocardioides sp.]HRD61602.1 hypothetical protein [Nocardioides sp.]HRK45043.1 hypothetical protein [Nocardioides sp.]
MPRVAWFLTWITALVLLPVSAARADCSWVTQVVNAQGAVQTNTTYVCSGTTSATAAQGQGAEPPSEMNLDAICTSTAMSLGLDPYEVCAALADSSTGGVTPALVAEAFSTVPLPASQLSVQPPGGRTLVNFDTNSFTETGEFDRAVNLLGQRVELHVVPSVFTSRFGDGATLATDDPGSPYPDLEVTHRYLRKGRVAPSVDTTYTARFRVEGGPWLDVPGSVTVSGAAVDLEVVTATPTLIGSRR